MAKYEIGIVFWAGLVGIGMVAAMKYEAAPSRESTVPKFWPAETTLALAADVPSLLTFLHPKCVCSQATLVELEKLLTVKRKGLRSTVVLVVPQPGDVSWIGTPLANQAARLPGARVVLDPGGAEAARFGALTSGLTLLYTQRGDLAFAGGITPARGQRGPNRGSAAILSAIGEEAAARKSTRVFGCELNDPTTRLEI